MAPEPVAGDSMVARVTLARATAERAFAALSESIDPEQTACSLFEASAGHWTMAVHFRDPAIVGVMRALVEAAAGAEAAGALAFEIVAETDWVAASLAGLAPVTAGRFVVHGAHGRERVPANLVGIEIEAALAFGTGHHGTTRGCLLALHDLMKRHRRPFRTLDIGTGTGILAIAAARALRRPVLAGDSDARAVRTSRANARLNRAGSMVEIVQAAGLMHRRFRQSGPFELVFANILLGPLQRLARPIAGVIAPHARVVLSGLLPAQANAALASYRLQGLRLERRIVIDGWITLVLRRRA